MRDEMINDIISECSKLTQKEYKTRYDYVGKVIHLELCKKLKFNHTNKWYMHNLVNEMHKFPWAFEMQTDHQILTRRPDLVIISKKKKENLPNYGLCGSGRPQSKIEKKKKDMHLHLARKLKKKTLDYESDCDCNWYSRYSYLNTEPVRGQVKIIQTTTLLRLAGILSRVLETWGDLLSLKLPWKPIG